MRQLEYLLILRDYFSLVEKDKDIPISINELAEILHSSDRNTLNILKKFKQSNRIKWVPGRGRGNKSMLCFSSTFQELAQEYIYEMVQEENVTEIINFIHTPYLSEFAQKTLYSHLQANLGPKIENTITEEKNVVKILLSQEIKTLDPMNALLYSEAHLITHLYNTLVTFKDGELRPSLAYAWKQQDNGRKWVFHLRKSVFFHNGEMLSARDVKYTIERIVSNPQSPVSPLLEDINKVEIVGSHKICFYLKEQNYFFPRILSSFHCSILNYSFQHDNSINGTGPFMLQERKEHFIRLKAFQTYFQERPLIDRLDTWMLKNANRLPNQISSLQLLSHQQPTVTHNQELSGSRFLLFNLMKKGFHDNLYFRKCIQQLLSPELLVNELKGNRFLPAASFLPSISKRMVNHSNDISIASTYLHKSTYNGEELKLYYFELNEGYESAEWIQKQGRKIGLNISLFPINYAAQNSEDVLKNADLLLLSVILDTDVELGLYTIYKSNTSFIRQFFSHETINLVDHFLHAFVRRNEKETRIEQLIEIEKMLKAKDIIHFLYHAVNKLNYHPALKNISFQSYGLPNFQSLWIDSDEI
ncbi:hypothetical protein CJ195_08835 [Bacillus sp. UMB0899]|nr:hypothetical protein CJ195_08835 [Bacillus sp. UMB0899]